MGHEADREVETYANQPLLDIAREIAKQRGPEPHWDTTLLMRIVRMQYDLLNPGWDK